jgi:hypothetical protein
VADPSRLYGVQVDQPSHRVDNNLQPIEERSWDLPQGLVYDPRTDGRMFQDGGIRGHDMVDLRQVSLMSLKSRMAMDEYRPYKVTLRI